MSRVRKVKARRVASRVALGKGDGNFNSLSTPAGRSGLRAESGVGREGFVPPLPSGSARGLQVEREKCFFL